MSGSWIERLQLGIAGIAWPPMLDARGTALAARLHQFEATERRDAETIANLQFAQLAVLAVHHARQSPQFARRLRDAWLKPDDLASPEGLRKLPVLTRRQLQTANDLYATTLPDGHLPLGLPITLAVPRLIAALEEFAPAILLVYPGTLAALAAACRTQGRPLAGLAEIRTLGETLTPRLRTATMVQFGCPLSDCYSSQEVGYIALHCPASGLYHVMSESLFVEILDEAGNPCGEGETGRVTLTDLHNYATPLVRYDIGDYAQVGPACSCGRGLPTLARILGRERNLVRKPDGTRHWPLVGFDRFRALAPISQYQLVQENAGSIEFRAVAERTLSDGEEKALAGHVRAALGHDFAVRFTYFGQKIPAGANGKFEEFLCLV